MMTPEKHQLRMERMVDWLEEFVEKKLDEGPTEADQQLTVEAMNVLVHFYALMASLLPKT